MQTNVGSANHRTCVLVVMREHFTPFCCAQSLDVAPIDYPMVLQEENNTRTALRPQDRMNASIKVQMGTRNPMWKVGSLKTGIVY